MNLIPPPSTLPPGSVVWAYLRDPGGEAQEQSIGQQEREIVAYCARHGLILARVFADEAKTGGTDKGRDGFAEMIDATNRLEDRPAGLLIWSTSRFARNQNDSPYYRATLRKRGLVIHSLTELLPDDPTGIVIEAMYDFTNAEKLRQTSRDVKRGLHALARQGFAPGGFPPRGYKAEPVTIGYKRDGRPRIVSRWVEDPELWDDVQLAWRLAGEGKSYGELQAATGGRVFKSKSCWPSFFANKTYLGIGKCGDLEVPDHHPPAVDKATWDKVQSIFKARRKGPHRAPKLTTPAILSGVAVCLHCGDKMFYGSDSKRKKYHWPYYLCGRKTRHGAKSCEGRRIDARKAEATVFDAILNRVLTPGYAQALLAELRAQFSDTTAIDRQAESLARQIAECEIKIKRLNDQIENFGPARSTADKLRERESELDRLQAELRQVEAKRKASQIEITAEALNAVLATWRDQIVEARDKRDVIALRGLLARFVSKVELGYNSARVSYRYPLDAFSQNSDPSLWGHSEILGKSIMLLWE